TRPPNRSNILAAVFDRIVTLRGNPPSFLACRSLSDASLSGVDPSASSIGQHTLAPIVENTPW
ncbi:MAG TPA: hypothetical protein VFQ31_09220, partial [Methyloceanibacter sp.]|nr:hypothetical protein [Methyloceanibacter sp.]